MALQPRNIAQPPAFLPDMQAKRCHMMADEASRWAARSSGATRTGFEASAAKWRKLAGDMEARTLL
jgi:hypothetical protein